MRHIDIESKDPPEEWCKKAKELTERLKNASTPQEREKIINKNKLWTNVKIKKWLLDLSCDKCWYSEAKEIYSFYDVDHFRPKKRAKQLDGTEREGYWWLAFDWKNYRISGSIGNRPNKDEEGRTRGKRDYFPLRHGSPVATTPYSDINDEVIYILDPTDPCDPLYLTFEADGRVYPSARDNQSWAYKRAEITVELLHLNYYLLKEERVRVWQKCDFLVNEIDNLIKKQNDRLSVTDNANLKSKMKELKEMISEKAELSSTARACLLNSESETAKIIVSLY